MYFALFILVIVVLAIITTNQFTLGIKIIFLGGVLIVSIIAYFLYKLWHKYFYEKFFKTSVNKMEELHKKKLPYFLMWSAFLLLIQIVSFIFFLATTGKSYPAGYDLTLIHYAAIIIFWSSIFITIAGPALTIISIVREKGLKRRIIQIPLLFLHLLPLAFYILVWYNLATKGF